MRDYQGQNASVTERLSALRTPPPPNLPQDLPLPSSKVAIRRELLIGGIVVFVAIAILVPFFSRDRQPRLAEQIQTAAADMAGTAADDVATDANTPVDQSGLAAGEAYVAIPVESGHYPPRLAAGHIVRISITTTRDGIPTTESLPETATVQAVAPVSDVGTTFVVTVLASEDLLDKVAGSDSVDLAIVGEVAQ